MHTGSYLAIRTDSERGYRTNNNPFILRCIKEWARAKNLTVFVAAVDATNAFPSTDHPTLWLKLLNMGMGGALFDWLRMLYQKMEYYVRHGDRNSAEFKVSLGYSLVMLHLLSSGTSSWPTLLCVKTLTTQSYLVLESQSWPKPMIFSSSRSQPRDCSAD